MAVARLKPTPNGYKALALNVLPPDVKFEASALLLWKILWNCYAGIEQLIVDMDGSIYRGWCKEGGVIGNINNKDLNLPSDPVVCTKTMCHCNFDIMCTKEK